MNCAMVLSTSIALFVADRVRCGLAFALVPLVHKGRYYVGPGTLFSVWQKLYCTGMPRPFVISCARDLAVTSSPARNCLYGFSLCLIVVVRLSFSGGTRARGPRCCYQ